MISAVLSLQMSICEMGIYEKLNNVTREEADLCLSYSRRILLWLTGPISVETLATELVKQKSECQEILYSNQTYPLYSA
jgi:hypothetical protein